MAGIRVQLPDDLEKKFRETAMKCFGYGKGALSKAAEEAFRNWITSAGKEKLKFKGDPVKAIEGMLKDVDLDSVELQHAAKKMWVRGRVSR